MQKEEQLLQEIEQRKKDKREETLAREKVKAQIALDRYPYII